MSIIPSGRRFRYGGVAVAFSCVLIAVVILINALFSALAKKFLWYTDLTSDEIYTLSDAAVEAIKDIDKDVEIIFCDDPDNIMEEYYQRLIYETALGLEKANSYVHVKNINIWRNPTAVDKYKADSKSSIYSTNVIIASGSEFRVYTVKAMYTFNDSNSTTPWAYSGEKKICSGILAVTQAEQPIVGITYNHGEPFATETDRAAHAELLNLLSDAGYRIQFVDLTKEELPEDCRLLFVYDPQDDFLTIEEGVSDISEIRKIDRFLDGTNAMMVFMGPSTPKLPVFEEYLEEWGIRFDHYTDELGTDFRATVKDSSNSITQDGMTVVGSYASSEHLGASLHKDLRTTYPPKVIFKNAMGISYTYSPIHHQDEDDTSIEYWYGSYYSNGVSRDIYDVFNAFPTAVEMANGRQVATADTLDGIKLMTVTAETHSDGKNTDYSYVLACGSTDFLSNALLQSNTYGNSDVMLYAMRAMGKETVPVGLTLKPFSSTTIENITKSEADQYTAVLIIAPAVVTFGLGLFFLVRRKYQ